MSIVVQKFGGTSVRDEQGRRHAYEHIKEALSEKKSGRRRISDGEKRRSVRNRYADQPCGRRDRHHFQT